jgi:hypothetical protein
MQVLTSRASHPQVNAVVPTLCNRRGVVVSVVEAMSKTEHPHVLLRPPMLREVCNQSMLPLCSIYCLKLVKLLHCLHSLLVATVDP